MSSKVSKAIGVNEIAGSIVILRRQRLLLDQDLAKLYGVSTKRFNEQVRRNKKRFPADFMFQVTIEERDSLRSHFATGYRYIGQKISIDDR